MTISEMKFKRSNLIVEARNLINKGLVDAAERHLAQIDTLSKSIDNYRKLSNLEKEGRSFSRSPRPCVGGSNTSQKDSERRSLLDYMRTGHVSAEHRDLGTVTGGSISGGSQLIPQGFMPELLEAQKAWGALTTVVNIYETDSGQPIKIALSNDTTQMFNTVATEITPASEEDPSFSTFISNLDEGDTGLIKVSFAQLEDSAFDIDNFIRDSFGKRYWRGVSNLITNGNGSNVQSIVSTATLGATSASPTTITYQDILNVYAALDPAYIETSTWVMNSSTRAALLGVTDTTGRPLFQPALSSPNGALDMLLGRPVVLNQFQPGIAAGSRALLFGDMKAGYTLRTLKDGLNILRLAERYADTREVGFFGYGRIGGFATDAGTHPIVALQQHS